jgi:hypothetical protein
MLESKREKLLSATRNANERLARNAARDAEFLREREKRFQADAVKTARLRGLRLAKEAADRETLAREADEKRAAAATARLAHRTRKTAVAP